MQGWLRLLVISLGSNKESIGIIIKYCELLRITNNYLAIHGQQCGAVAENIQPNTVALLAGQREGLLAS